MRHPHPKAISLAAISVLLAACVTMNPPKERENPPPQEKFSAFGHFELARLEHDADKAVSDRTIAKFEEILKEKMSAVTAPWNAEPKNARVLVITPVVEKMRFQSGIAHFFFPVPAYTIIHVRYTDKAGGKTVAEPVFFDVDTNYPGGGFWSPEGLGVGVRGGQMLVGVAEHIADYTRRNYADAVGGPTGVR